MAKAGYNNKEKRGQKKGSTIIFSRWRGTPYFGKLISDGGMAQRGSNLFFQVYSILKYHPRLLRHPMGQPG